MSMRYPISNLSLGVNLLAESLVFANISLLHLARAHAIMVTGSFVERHGFCVTTLLYLTNTKELFLFYEFSKNNFLTRPSSKTVKCHFSPLKLKQAREKIKKPPENIQRQ